MTPHDLNKRLAEIIGVAVFETGQYFDYIWNVFEDEDDPFPVEWDPCHDPAQMGTVKAWLREQGWGYQISWSWNVHAAWMNPDFLKDVIARKQRRSYASDTSELIALAMAICAAIPKNN